MDPTDRSAVLATLGLAFGDRVRFRRRERDRWREGVVSGVHKDGSIAMHDQDGRARAVPAERLEVRTTGPRGAPTWEPLLEHAARPEQLRLLQGQEVAPVGRRPRNYRLRGDPRP